MYTLTAYLQSEFTLLKNLEKLTVFCTVCKKKYFPGHLISLARDLKLQQKKESLCFKLYL